MAAEIKPLGSTSTAGQKSLSCEKPVLTSKIDNIGDEVHALKVLSQGASILSISNDK